MSIRIAPALFRILLAEDDVDDAEILCHAARKSVPKVLMQVVHRGEEVIDILSGGASEQDPDRGIRPSLILLDIALPGKSGLQVLSWIRERPEFVRIPVIMLTGSIDPDDVHRALSLGANSYLMKPASTSALEAMVQSLVCYWSALNRTGF
ncbi:MAG: response regulator [Planctomycetaceae bacterium]|nr:response regulator [Planctomycetaceae bacterium]